MLLSVTWTVAIGLLLACSLLSEVTLLLVTTGLVTTMLRLEISVRLVWVNYVPRLEFVQMLQSGTLLQATDKLDYGIFQGTRLLVLSNAASKGAFALILNRPKLVMGEKVHIGVSVT